MNTHDSLSERHLTDAELFGLAAPATGDPEALPEHLSRCHACSRALADWKEAVRDLAEEDVDPISRRTPQEWRAAEEATMAAIRRAGRRGMPPAARWALGIAASLLLFALALPMHRPTVAGRLAPTIAAASAKTPIASDDAGLSAADRADDALLRDVSSLARGTDDSSDLALVGRL